MSNKHQGKIHFTDSALSQIQLMLEHDFTIKDKVFRITIGGKECNGFTYQTGFDSPHDDDIVLLLQSSKKATIEVHMDPFTANYFHSGVVDYKIDLESNTDGFVVSNDSEELYHGKFFKDESLLPKLEE